jgi:hypothetical protein
MEAGDLASAVAAHPALARIDRRRLMPKPDRSPIYEWARKHVVLPGSYAISGAFNVRTSPWLIPIFDNLQDETVRTITFIAGIQVGKTLVTDIAIPWIIVNDPGPISFTLHVDDMMERHAKMRLNPLLEACRPVAQLLPRPGPLRTTTEIHFGGFSLILNSANLSDQQSQSIRWKFNDEVFHPKWQGVYADAVGRVSAYEQVGTSKVMNTSQAGLEGDIADRTFREGHAAEWSTECPSCRKVHRCAFSIKADDAEPDAPAIGGVVWDTKAKGDDDLWNVARAVETTRFRCPHCGHESADIDATRERWKRAGSYVATNEKAPAKTRSYHVESIVSRPMVLLVEEWLNACNESTRTGNEEPLIKFRQKREAKSWRMEKTAVSVINVSSSTYTVEDYFEGAKKLDGETMRAMTIDRQQTHFWVEVGAWAATPAYSQLYFGRVDTIDQVRALQLRYAVPDSCVAQDRRYLPSETDKDSARFGWRGLMGVTRKTWTLRNETTDQLENYPHSDPKLSSIGGGAQVYFYEFSGDHMKDILFSALNGKGFRWNLPRNVSPLYLEHLKSEAKKEVRPGVWRYVEVRQNANHGIDTSSMMLAIAVIAGIVRFKLEDTV